VNLHLVTVQQQNSFLKLYEKRLQMLGKLKNNYITLMKQRRTTNCFQANLYILKKALSKAGMKTNKGRVTLLLCANKWQSQVETIVHL
jgi:hypothetical protein